MKNKHSSNNDSSLEGDMRRLVHELQVHKIELELQNEELVLSNQLLGLAHEKYKGLFDFAPIAYFVISKEGNIVDLNQKGAGMLRKGRQFLINVKFSKFIAYHSQQIFSDFLRKVFTNENIETCEIEMMMNPPVHSIMILTGHAIEVGEQCLISVLDITARKKAESALNDKMEELKKAYKQLEEYSFHNQELKQFASISSHELQQPLRTINNFIQIFKEEYSGVFDENAYKYLDVIRDSAKRMNALIDALSDYSRLGRHKTLKLVNFNELINNVISDLDGAIKSTGAEIQVSEMPVINAYEIEIYQVFLNLIGNAIKFHKKNVHPVVHLTSEKIGDAWKFSVKDDGIGVSKDHFNKLFHIFQRLHTNENEFEGKGIGLSVCKKIIELHQGTIWIETNDYQGITVYFTLPNLIL